MLLAAMKPTLAQIQKHEANAAELHAQADACAAATGTSLAAQCDRAEGRVARGLAGAFAAEAGAQRLALAATIGTPKARPGRRMGR